MLMRELKAHIHLCPTLILRKYEEANAQPLPTRRQTPDEPSHSEVKSAHVHTRETCKIIPT